MSSTQITIILKIFKDFFTCNIVFDANHHYPGEIQRLFRLQNCLRRKSSFSWKYSKTFWLQNCLSRKSYLSWKHSKTFPPAKLSSTQIIFILKIFKEYCLRRKSAKNFSAKLSSTQIIIILKICKIILASLCWKYSKTFSPAKLSSTQITIILKIFKDFFTCNIVFDANHHYPGEIQRLFRLQNCSKTFSPAKLSSTQIIFIIILKILKDFFTCNIVLDANHHYPESIQRIFPLQNCIRRKSSLSWKYAKFFSPAKLS